MSSERILLQAQHRARVAESIEHCHTRFAQGMRQFGAPLGWQGLECPPPPHIRPGSGDTIGLQSFLYPASGLKMQMTARFRHKLTVGLDNHSGDDRLDITFKTSNTALDYRAIITDHFPKVVEAYRGYRAWAVFGFHRMKYTDAGWNEWSGRPTTNPTFHRLCSDPRIDVDGRNNIYTLEPAVFWDSELCRRALGYEPREVMRRLEGQALLVRPLLDGIYIVFDDDPALTYEAYVEMNVRFKKILGVE